jgi:hypothetical protein
LVVFGCPREADSVSRCVTRCIERDCANESWETVRTHFGEPDELINEFTCIGGGCIVDGAQNF